jgi:hypothetical protein
VILLPVSCVHKKHDETVQTFGCEEAEKSSGLIIHPMLDCYTSFNAFIYYQNHQSVHTKQLRYMGHLMHVARSAWVIGLKGRVQWRDVTLLQRKLWKSLITISLVGNCTPRQHGLDLVMPQIGLFCTDWTW